jgi:hypothetical protein
MNKKLKCYSVHPRHLNVIIVKKWRNIMNEYELTDKDQKTVDIMYPTWRKVFLNTHKVLTNTAKFLWTPVTKVMEEINGTARAREILKKL